MAKVNRAIKKKERRNIPLGIVHIIASFNNVRVVFTTRLPSPKMAFTSVCRRVNPKK